MKCPTNRESPVEVFEQNFLLLIKRECAKKYMFKAAKLSNF